MRYTWFMRGLPLFPRASRRCGFSLLELSIVIAIFSVVAVMGLEVLTSFLNRNAYVATQNQLKELDKALDQYYKVYGRLPCPATQTLDVTSIAYGLEDCSVATITVGALSPVQYGALPFRTLNLPLTMSLDAYGSKIHYLVTSGFTASTTFATASASIEVRTGLLEQPCSALCSVLADPSVGQGAAYLLFSGGPDQRGTLNIHGTLVKACTTTTDPRIDTQNCFNVVPSSGSPSPATIPHNVFFDSRFNAGSQPANYDDDAVVWRPRGML